LFFAAFASSALRLVISARSAFGSM